MNEVVEIGPHTGTDPAVGLSASAPQFSASQAEVVASGMLDASAILHVATSWGKTWMARLAIRASVAKGLKAVYLCPLRALAKELSITWADQFPGFKVGVYTGESGLDALDDNPHAADADILIATPEKLDWYVRAWEKNLSWLAQIDLLVVDELHNMGAGSRGATLEGLIGRLKAINPFVRVLGLSATLGNPHELGAWLGASVFESKDRPVPLTWSIATFKNQADKQSIALDECHRTAAEGGQSIVFVQSRPRAQSLATYFASCGLRASAHHAGLSRKVRDEAEAAFRRRELDVIVATPTLAQGVNLPARKVVVYDLTRWEGGDWKHLSTNEIWQLAGRAGRRGMDTCGEAVLVAPKWDQKTARGYLKGQFEPILSQVAAMARATCEQTMVIYGSRLAGNEQQAARVMQRLLLGHGMAEAALSKLVSDATSTMITAGMLRRDEFGEDGEGVGYVIRATRLGRIAVRHQLSPQTVIAWAALHDSMPDPRLFDLLLVACASTDFNGRLRCEMDQIEGLQEVLDAEPMAMRALDRKEWSKFVSVKGRDFVGAVKTAAVLRAWTRLGDLEEAAEAMRVLPHEIEECRKEALRMLQAMGALAKARQEELESQAQTQKSQNCPGEGGQTTSLPSPSPFLRKLEALRAMVSAGLDDQQATLALIDGVGPILARRLIEAGVEDIEDLAQVDLVELGRIPGVSAARALQWSDEAGDLLKQGGDFWFKEVCGEIVDPAQPTSGRTRVAQGLDYFRWLRAAQLVLKREEATGGVSTWIVSGGSAPHMVSAMKGGTTGLPGDLTCDCQDAAKGRLCKHQIAVRHQLNDPLIPSFAAPFQERSEGMDLMEEWSSVSITSTNATSGVVR